MASASDTSLLSSVEQAEKDLAMYAAIIGCRPSVDAPPATIAPADASPEPEEAAHAPLITPAPEWAIPHPSIAAEPSQPGRLSIWMRHVSCEAKKRIHEAKARLIA
jgi:hypothetical protein